jgi:peptidoglycan/LPS O-acetylase OafA/YrhL
VEEIAMRREIFPVLDRSQDGPDRHFPLDGLRGLAALAVAVYHYLSWARGITIPSMGTFTVYLFFSLSALTMMMVYEGRLGSRTEISAFFRNRAFRIVPLLVVTSFGAALLSRFDPGVTLKALLTATGLYAVAPGALSVGNGAWSIGIEIVFYAAFPAIALAVPRLRTRTLVLVLAGLVGVQQAWMWTIGTSWETYTLPITFAPFFAIGLLVHRTRRTGASFLPATLSLAVLASLSLVLDVRGTAGGYLAASAVAGGTLWLAWRSRVPAALEPLCDLLGRISYSLYLTHWFAFVVVRELGLDWPFFFALAVAAAWACEHWFERPAREWLRAAFGRGAGRLSPAASAHRRGRDDGDRRQPAEPQRLLSD